MQDFQRAAFFRRRCRPVKLDGGGIAPAGRICCTSGRPSPHWSWPATRCWTAWTRNARCAISSRREARQPVRVPGPAPVLRSKRQAVFGRCVARGVGGFVRHRGRRHGLEQSIRCPTALPPKNTARSTSTLHGPQAIAGFFPLPPPLPFDGLRPGATRPHKGEIMPSFAPSRIISHEKAAAAIPWVRPNLPQPASADPENPFRVIRSSRRPTSASPRAPAAPPSSRVCIARRPCRSSGATHMRRSASSSRATPRW